jgi:hypothetical protein
MTESGMNYLNRLVDSEIFIKYPKLQKFKSVNAYGLKQWLEKLRKILLIIDLICSFVDIAVVTTLYFEVLKILLSTLVISKITQLHMKAM